MNRILFILWIGLTIPLSAQDLAERSIFDVPSMLVQQSRLQAKVQALYRSGDYRLAIENCQSAIVLFPREPANYYIKACCQTRLGEHAHALDSLEAAVDRGFNNPVLIRQDPNLRPLRKSERFNTLVKRASSIKPEPSPWITRLTSPSSFENGVAWVTESNTSFNPKLGVFESSFLPTKSARLSGQPVTNENSEIGLQVRKWYMKGTAAGLKNHLYDNHDGDHSNMRHAIFPQLQRVEFCDAAKKHKLDHGLQLNFFYNAITIGNTSEAMTHPVFWRSLPRLAYTSRRHASLLYQQYTRNHLYVYPEHRDHDPKHGDTFSSNTPYLIISQGSSGSDREFLEAVAWTLASFQPKTKQKLAEHGALMAAVQMIFRRTNQRVDNVDDYLSGKAHPSVFDGNTIDEWAMIKLAHEIKPEKVPPVVELKVLEEDEPKLGVDYFEHQPNVKLFDTPAAIARVLRSTQQTYRMVVSAKPSYDLNNRPLTYHWRVLRGDASQIEINPLNEDRSTVEIIVPHQVKRPIEPGSKLTSTRVDIGAFVHNGTYYSAPAFVSMHSPRNETRKYNEHGKVESVEYLPFGTQYEDPLITTPRAWTDQYIYDEQQRLIGWVRTRKTSVEEFTADGALVTKKDELGRAIEAHPVRYQNSTDPKRIPSTLEQQMAPEVLHYKYDSPTDKIGRVVQRASAS